MERSADTLVGRVLDGRYRVGPKIARGGMATVYEATDLRLDRTVAVKVMHEGLADDDEFVQRFQREARSAARLAHHNVVAVFDTGDDNGTLFLVMEYVPGHTLRDLIRKEAPMSPGKALAVIEPLLSALAAAHDAGILHRDVKPENVLIADSAEPWGRVKVADFGLARAINSETQHTATGGVLIGTVSYLSPELVVNGRADARADVYAVGVIIYEMLTGQKPHQADSPIQVAYKHVHEDVPAPSGTVPGIPPYVDALVARATSRDTALRPADARVLLHQVRRVRQALDEGVFDDSDLVADLTPTGPIGDRTPTGELPVEILEPQELVEIAELVAVEHTSITPRAAPSETRRPGSPPPPRTSPAHPQRQRRSRRGAIALIVVLLLAIAAGAAGWYFGVARYTATPSVLDLTSAAAKVKLDQSGLAMKVEDTAYSETIRKGLVIRTDPDPGDRVLKDGTVGAVVSLGPERHGVPDVAGRSLDDAQQQLDEARLSYGDEVQRFDEKVAEGQVIATDPVAGTLLRRETAVDVIVSKGPKPIKIADFTGKVGARAAKKLGALGFKVESSEDNSDTVPTGKVISQTPRSGTGVKDDPITLVVSKGPVLVEVPSVKGAGVDAATATLEGAGFKVNVVRSSVYIGVQFVVSQNPPGGTMARKGSTITIGVV